MLVGASSDAQTAPPVRHVLVLQSFDRGIMALDYLMANLRVDLDRRTGGGPVNVVQVVVTPTGSVVAPERAVVDYLHSIYAGRHAPELIVTQGGPAAVFARKYLQELFPDAPRLLAAVDQRYLGVAPLEGNETAVAVNGDFPSRVDEILRLLPDTRHVFMVVGSGPLAAFWRPQLESDFARFNNRVTFIWSDDLSFEEVLDRSANLPSHSAILYLTFGTDAEGGTYADERVLKALHAAANAPVFGIHSVMLGTGIVGGTLMSIETLSRNVADAAVRILNGEPPGTVKVPTQQVGPPVFDGRELQRWSIPESRLPPNSVVRYRRPSLWSEYQLPVLTGLGALLLQSLLIVGLLYQRRARQDAEFDSRRNLALAADASRRETMSALTSSITHQLRQPLSAMMLNAETLRMIVGTDRATSETMEEILLDIEGEAVRASEIIDRHRGMLRSHTLEKKPLDLRTTINQSLALVAHEISARQVDATLKLPSHACIVDGDHVLLQQVLVNLVMNAMDAMAETPPTKRRLTLRCEVRSAEVDVSVHDSGTGIPADAQLFTPFVTTKPHGLGIGLAIARTIIEAHEGTVAAHNNPEGGATFTVTLPRSNLSALPLAPAGAA